ncbi:TPA: DUF262 domain-containing protein [Vibrio cholerae]|uniref:DUF262 domain-containing protein n=1 Tax=Vibrio cholerae TaxID=666 RepID=UPI0011586D7A|nr:DUF262 domain-containing protein [Vibrio cholerae]ELD3369385.1 DUF262 domain-containing protein [Vibrio cholerae]TQO85376.1 DUF262 domain-containing protein [Vibrio cholerae]TYA70872.1 DUF262 domain-containing protein [Vibrio cholerae]GIB48643.1 putative uncharacterized type I restriction-modification system protein [Vibrio cholerae]HDL9489928.1 DUF262 domain-containing protein [Vibrio cholerae]
MKNKIIPSHFFTVNEQSLVSMFCQGKKRFVIPYNQRPWSWKNNNIDELWQDILKTSNGYFHACDENDSWEERENPISDPHFIGAFVFEEKDNNYYVVDGQQRITSISMVIAALRNQCEKLKNNTTGSLKRNVAHHLDSYKAWLVASFDDDQVLTRLQVDKNIEDFFSFYIIESVCEIDRQEYLEEADIDLDNEPNIKAIKKSFDYVNGKVSEFFDKFSDPVIKYKAIKSIFSTIEECFICISSNVKKESFSYEVFKCLNAKGLPLSEADKLKNELFTQSKLSEHEEIKNAWSEMQGNIPNGAVAQFIRLRYVALFGECSSTRMHSIITEFELKNSKIPQVVRSWKNDSEIYSRISMHKIETGKYAYTEEELSILRNIKGLNIGLSEILLFSAHKFLFETRRDDFLEVLRITENFCFRNLTIMKRDTSLLESYLGKAAREIKYGKPIKEIRKYLRDNSSPTDFYQSFSLFSARSATLQFYILSKIDSYLLKSSGLKLAQHSQEFNVEHILPKKLATDKRQGEWLWATNEPEKHKQMVNRLGNLCLLEGDINRDVSNFDWNAKRFGEYPEKLSKRKDGSIKKSFKDSELPMVKEIIKNDSYRSWSFDVIEQRQRHLAEYAAEIWRI